ncbi:MAG: HD domain-containing protein [Acidaminobacteraceae bacterium]
MNNKHKEILNIVNEKLTCSAHNMDHIIRVYEQCLIIAKYENNVDMEILVAAALLHDIARVEESHDKTGTIDHAILGAEIAADILNTLGYNKETIKAIHHCIVTHRFRTGNLPLTIEAKILFDADKLDAIGAVGIARTFMLSGQFGQRLSTSVKYDNNNSSGNGRIKDMANHTPFIEYELKLKKIPEKLYTKKAIEIGKSRILFMDNFFKTLKSEID